MSETTKIKVPFNFDYTELTAIEEYLEKQEEKGLRLKEIDSNKFVFEKAEPRKIRYSVEVFKSKNARFVEPYPEFVEACEAEGWELAGFYHDDLYIFRTEKEDAVDIMTDDREKMKIVRKRALLKPGNYFWFFYSLSRIGSFLMRFDGTDFVFLEINQSNPYYYFDISFLILIFSFPMLILIDYFVWLYKAKKATKTGEKITYLNLEQANKKRKIKRITFLILVAGMMCFNSFIDAGFAVNEVRFSQNIHFSGVIYWIFFVLFVAATFAMADSVIPQKITQNKKKPVACVFISLCFLVLTVTVIADNKIKAEEINYNGAPITFRDFGYSELLQEDRSTIRATRFAQQYRCNIRAAEALPDENTDSVLMYEVFVSDFPRLRDKYIEKALEEHDIIKEEAEVIVGSETKWDIQYKVKSDQKVYIGLAVKDDTVIRTVLPFHTDGQDFFEVAYEKLFGEKE